MSHSASIPASLEEEPLISNRFLLKSLAYLAAMAAMTGALVLGGHWAGKKINLAGHTDSREVRTIDIGPDRLLLPSNVIRFETQRRNGTAERVDLYLSWPDMEGYTREHADRFNDLSKSRRLIFVQITQSVMSRDMSGRVEPIYSHYFRGNPQDAGNGLTLHHFAPEAGYQDDVLLTAPRAGQPDFAVRCILPKTPQEATSGDCQRDIGAGKDLSVLYRFSSDLLPEWEALDRAVAAFVAAHMGKPKGEKR
ncbi:hypothetical protein [Gellertiella hungarica]|uniref:Transmembrane anchored protein n=1 Tax=Gellertiella hungarica TaxID=1572859 RepID=A0A7W6NJY2_9HYPH|nr:hypothetical protein [Gellertiella hungarica]MBB4064880.1 hypothetical protein [Gellertiella hungarica]